MTEERRDTELARALAELEVPEHRPGFASELERRLAAEAVARARRRWAVRSGAIAVAAVAVVLVVGIPGTERTPRIGGPQVATAAEIKAAVRRAFATLRSVGGVVVSEGPGRRDHARWRFTLTADGDFRLIGLTERERITYDASAGVARRVGTSASLGGSALFASARQGVAPGPPDQGPPTWILPDEFGAYVRALLAARSARVAAVTYAGRPAWRVNVGAVPNTIVPAFSGDRLEITVDRRTGIPVRVRELKQGAVLREIRIDDLSVDATPPPHAFRLAFPAGAEILRSDDGFRRVALSRVSDIVGYAPVVPRRVPDGFHLAEVAVARQAAPVGGAGTNPPSRMVVSLSYRRGLDQFLVTTRLAHVPGSPQAWDDPLATGEGFRDRAERITLPAGALAGVESRLVIVPRGIPHLWAVTDRLVVTVGGDLSRAELLGVAQSLTPSP